MPTARLLALAVLLVLALAAPAAAADYVPGQVVVRFAADSSSDNRAQALDTVEAQSTDALPVPHTRVVDLGPGESVTGAVRRLEGDDAVAWAEPNFVYRATRVPNDTSFPLQWGELNTGQTFDPDTAGDGEDPITGIPGADIGATTAWDTTTGSPSVLVGVADSGVLSAHPDLAPNVRLDLARDFRAADGQLPDPNTDAMGHGTHVAGIIGAAGNNGMGVAGVSWNPGLVPIRALNPDGGTNAQIASGFAYAGQLGLRVVNASLGGPGESQAQRDAIRLAPNTLFVIAAGNDGVDDDGPGADFPCALPEPNIVCVAATDPRDGLAPFSNFGATTVDLGAPGTNIVSTYPTFTRELDAEFEPADWTLSDPDGAFTADGTELMASYDPDVDQWARVAAPLDLTGKAGCSATIAGSSDIVEGEAVLSLERSTDGGLTWTPIATFDEPRSSFDGQVDLAADDEDDVQVRFHWTTTGALSPGHSGIAITKLLLQCARAGKTYLVDQGTSSAAPEVSGAAALLLARNPSLTTAQLRDALLSTTTAVPALAGKTVTGGRLNVAAALAKVAPMVPGGDASPAPSDTSAPTTGPPVVTAPETAPPLVPPVTVERPRVRLVTSAAQPIARRGTVELAVRVDRDSLLRATGDVAIGHARVAGRVRLRAARAQAKAGRAVRLKLRLTSRGLRSVRAAVRGHRRVVARVTVRATAPDAPATVTRKTVRQR